MSRPVSSHVLIVEARFYTDIANAMADGAIAALQEAGVSFDRISVPGAFEIPAAIEIAHRGWTQGSSRPYDGYIALGCVIRGETTHYDYVCEESARGLQKLALDHALAIGYGIITVEDDDQAWVRADPNKKNKGGFAANACLEMIALKRRFGVR